MYIQLTQYTHTRMREREHTNCLGAGSRNFEGTCLIVVIVCVCLLLLLYDCCMIMLYNAILCYMLTHRYSSVPVCIILVSFDRTTCILHV